MRILQVSSALRFGGCEEHICDLSAGLSARGVEVRAVVRADCEWKDRLADALSGAPFEADLKNPKDLRSAFRIAGIAREVGTDFIHVHLACDYAPASIAARMASARLILTHHGSEPISLATRFLTRNPARVIAVSRGSEQSLSESFGRKRLVCIPSGHSVHNRTASDFENLADEFRRVYGISIERKVVAAIGELSPNGGQDDLILSAAEIIREVPTAYFVIIGKETGGDGFKRKLRRLVKVSDLEECVLFLDRLEDTNPLLATSSVFASAARSGNGADLAMLEAMEAGVPVAATGTKGARDLIETERHGLLSDPGDPVGLARSVCRLLTDPALAAETARSARRRAKERFSLELMVESTLEVYEAAFAKR
ncbi:MAG TPA: glycosyltransferase family 4 protein [Aridibacter sp.]|nr:glycosyltransferase family 4 protein [Aridibacter sp.]